MCRSKTLFVIKPGPCLLDFIFSCSKVSAIHVNGCHTYVASSSSVVCAGEALLHGCIKNFAARLGCRCGLDAPSNWVGVTVNTTYLFMSKVYERTSDGIGCSHAPQKAKISSCIVFRVYFFRLPFHQSPTPTLSFLCGFSISTIVVSSNE